MIISFFKYQGTGNDFVMIDNRDGKVDRHDKQLPSKLCERRFGIGADGVILIENHTESDFEMVYINPDGSQSFCGNGARCAVAFSNFLGIIDHKTTFHAYDGIHQASIDGNTVSIKMGDVNEVEQGEGYYFMDTGSPHYVSFVDDLDGFNVYEEGRAIRYNDRFRESGTNVNFAKGKDGGVDGRTYERGVENETFSCGTGVTAIAISASLRGISKGECKIDTKGGRLTVRFDRSGNSFNNVWLIGSADQVYIGEVNV